MAGMKIFVQIITEEENERILRAVNFLSDTDTVAQSQVDRAYCIVTTHHKMGGLFFEY